MLVYVPSYIWAFAAPLSALTLLMLVGIVLAWWTGGGRWSDRLRNWPLFILLGFCLFPLGDWLIAPLENHYKPALPQKVSGIIQLGGAENVGASQQRQEPVTSPAGGRYLKTVTLARQYPSIPVVFTGGGRIADLDYREADVAASVYKNLGISRDRMTFERDSLNTYQNAVFTYRLIQPAEDSVWLLVTSAAHLPRAVASFRKAGWNVVPVPADYRTNGADRIDWLQKPNMIDQFAHATFAMHEYIGLIVYRLLGRTDTVWPD